MSETVTERLIRRLLQNLPDSCLSETIMVDTPLVRDVASELRFLSRDLMAARQANDDVIDASTKVATRARELEVSLAAARREKEEMRVRTIKEIAQFIKSMPVHTWYLGILAERIRALTKPDPKKGAMSMTETLMDPDEKKFWDTADRQDDEQDTGSGK